MPRVIACVVAGAGAAAAVAYCALALSDARFVVPMIENPIRFLAIPAGLGALAGAGAHYATNRRQV